MEVSSLAARYNLISLQDLEEYKRGQIPVSHDMRESKWTLGRVMATDPWALLTAGHTREIRFVCKQSFMAAMGEGWLATRWAKTLALQVVRPFRCPTPSLRTSPADQGGGCCAASCALRDPVRAGEAVQGQVAGVHEEPGAATRQEGGVGVAAR